MYTYFEFESEVQEEMLSKDFSILRSASHFFHWSETILSILEEEHLCENI